jgi:chromosome segregation ATPase
LLLQDQLGDFQQQQQQGQQQHNTHTAPETSPSYDTAVQHLTAASSGGQLPGQFYGRLCNLAAVSDASAQPAVNAVLRERCNLATMMVVSDRATAAAVIDHFRQQRIGTVNCKILSELQQQRGPSYIQPAAAAAGGGGGISRPLLDLVQYDGTAVPGLQQLMEQLLGGWLLVESREVALQLLHLRKSMVTRYEHGSVGLQLCILGGGDGTPHSVGNLSPSLGVTPAYLGFLSGVVRLKQQGVHQKPYLSRPPAP